MSQLIVMVKLVTQLVVALIVVNVQIVIIAQLAIVAINVQTAKLAIHNATQIINVLVDIYTHYQPDRCYHLYHYINNIQLSIHYI